MHATDLLSLSSEWEHSHWLDLLILIPFFLHILGVTRRGDGSPSAPAPDLLSQLQIKTHFGKAEVAANNNNKKATAQ